MQGFPEKEACGSQTSHKGGGAQGHRARNKNGMCMSISWVQVHEGGQFMKGHAQHLKFLRLLGILLKSLFHMGLRAVCATCHSFLSSSPVLLALGKAVRGSREGQKT